MVFNGKYELQTSPSLIWETMLDPAYIIKLTPEVSTIREIEKDVYNVSTHIKVGPFKRRFEGRIQLERIEIEKQFKLNLTQQSPVGSVNGICLVTLNALYPATLLLYEGSLAMEGLIRRIGLPVIEKMIHPVIHDFLRNFDKKMTQS